MLHKGNSIWKRSFIRFAVVSSLVLFCQVVSAQQSVTLTWSPSTDTSVTGYKIYYGTASDNYTNIVDVGNVTNATISDLDDSTTYYFAATTYDDAGDESAFSNQASFTTSASTVPPPATPPPTVTNNVTSNITSVVIDENSAKQSIALSSVAAIANEYAALAPVAKASTKSPLVVSVGTSNPKLIPKPTISSGSYKNPGNMTFKPVAKNSGTAQITVTISSNSVSGKTKTLVVLTTQIFNITVVPSPLDYPRLLKELTSEVVPVGKSVTLKMSAAGRAPLKYQWMLNGVNIPSATSATLTLKKVTAGQSGNYSVMVYNVLGSTNSTPAVITIQSPVAVQSAPVAKSVSLSLATSQPELVDIQSTAAPQLTSMPMTNGKFSFQINGVSGTKYIVQASSDLKNWVSVQTNTAPFNFTDPDSGNFNQRFYRTETF